MSFEWGSKPGRFRRLAALLNVHPTMITHIFRGDAHLTPEQAIRIAGHFHLAGRERDALVLQVLHDRSSDFEARAYFRRRLDAMSTGTEWPRGAAQPPADASAAAIHSSWEAQAIWLLLGTRAAWTEEGLASALGLGAETTRWLLRNLAHSGAVKSENGRWLRSDTELPHRLPPSLEDQHRMHWRAGALAKGRGGAPGDLLLSHPVLIGRQESSRLRILLADIAAEVAGSAKCAAPEELWCLNLDWVRFGRCGVN